MTEITIEMDGSRAKLELWVCAIYRVLTESQKNRVAEILKPKRTPEPSERPTDSMTT